MSTYRLDKLLMPASVAVVGASPHGHSVGRIVLENLKAANYSGKLTAVNPHHSVVSGVPCVGALSKLSHTPDTVVVATPPQSVPVLIAEAGKRGVPSAIIITAGLGHGPGSLADATAGSARANGVRLVGPNSLGVMAPAAKFNATFATRMPRVGNLALISQSGAIAAGMVEWAAHRNIGFSGVVSLGDQVDVDFGDLLDYFALDKKTRSILLYIESIKDVRKFMSAARAAARIKPVVAVKSGRRAGGAKAAATHTGALAGSDAVYDAALQRAGVLRVNGLGELFDAAETLGRAISFRGPRLAILTNGGGLGVLAVDRLEELGGSAAELSSETISQLDGILPPTWSHANPVDIIGDADAGRYAAALEVLLDDSRNDAVLVMNVPTALARASEAAAAIITVAARYHERVQTRKPILTVWVGDDPDVAHQFEATSLPHFATEDAAVSGFMHLTRYHRALDALMETPPALPRHDTPDLALAQRAIARPLSERRQWLDPLEVADLLTAYAVPTVPIRIAQDAAEAGQVSEALLAGGATLAVKILSRDIVHKSDVGGVCLNLASPQAVRAAASDILARARAARPDARIAGVTLQPMIVRPKARELIAGVADDPTFGPVVVFGCGGTAVEVIDDKAIALPPLDLKFAGDLIGRTRISRLLRAYRDVPAVRSEDVALVLVKLGQMVVDFPEIRELDINPLLADENGVLALDARVAVAPPDRKFAGSRFSRLAIRPYPKEWERQQVLPGGRSIITRPVRPQDETMFQEFFQRVSPEDLRLRFFTPMRQFTHAFIARLTQLDYARAMAFLAVDEANGEMLGAVRLHADPNLENAEYGILLRSDMKNQGLGWMLMQLLIDYARSEGIKRITGQVLNENSTMLRMCREMGFSERADPEDPHIRLVEISPAGVNVSQER